MFAIQTKVYMNWFTAGLRVYIARKKALIAPKRVLLETQIVIHKDSFSSSPKTREGLIYYRITVRQGEFGKFLIIFLVSQLLY